VFFPELRLWPGLGVQTGCGSVAGCS